MSENITIRNEIGELMNHFDLSRSEFIKILETDKAYEGIMILHENKLLQYIIPELTRGVGVDSK